MQNNQPFVENKDAARFAQAIVDTVREPLLVLDQDLRVLAASRSFYLTFKVAKANTQGQLLYALGDGQWDIPKLRLLLEKIVPEPYRLHCHHWLILHGRYTCLARKPRCEVCLINDLCRWPEKTV